MQLMPPLREEAEALRLGLMMGLVPSEKVIAWADRVIDEWDHPPIEVIDVALASRQPPDELTRLLKRVPGPADLTTAAHRALGILQARAVGDGLDLGVIADMLWVYSSEADVPEAERFAASHFRYEHEILAYYGTSESLGAEVERFLSTHATEFDDA